jgi:uncharacterized protein (TIGR02271 family)
MDTIPTNLPTSTLPAHSTPSVAPEQVEASIVLPVIEERVHIERELVETGRVRVVRQVHEAEEEIRVAVQHDEVHVERVPLNVTLPAGAPTPVTRYEGDTMIIPVLREVAVVETRLLLVEELRITKQQLATQHVETVHLRKEELTVERIPPTPSAPTDGAH